MITLDNIAYEQEQARIASGLSPEAFDLLPGNPDWCIGDEKSKCYYIMVYRISQRIPAIANDAQIRDAERKSRKRW